MTDDEVREEAKRREDCLRRGVPWNAQLSPVERARQEAKEDERDEKTIQAACRKIYLAHGCEVYHLSQARASKQTPGIGDDFLIHRRLRAAWWHEYKTPRGRQSADQVYFQESLSFTACGYVLGGIDATWAQLRKIGATE